MMIASCETGVSSVAKLNRAEVLPTVCWKMQPKAWCFFGDGERMGLEMPEKMDEKNEKKHHL